MKGTVYLLHFSQPYKHAAHYLGFTTDIEARLAEHEAGYGARLLQVAKAAGITWTLARTWPGDRKRERQLKAQGGASRRCPECGIRPRTPPGQRKEQGGVRHPQDKNADQASAGRPKERALVKRPNVQLRDKIERNGAVLAETRQRREGQVTGPSAEPVLADREAEL